MCAPSVWWLSGQSASAALGWREGLLRVSAGGPTPKLCALVRHRVSYKQARTDTFQSVACSALDVAIDVPYMKEVSLMRHSNLRLHVISEVDTIRQFAAFKNQHSPNVVEVQTLSKSHDWSSY